MERHWSLSTPKVTIGIDLGDRASDCCVLDEQGVVRERFQVTMTRKGFERRFGELRSREWSVASSDSSDDSSDDSSVPSLRVVLEAGTHSPWTSRLLKTWGHEVIIANPTRLYGGKRGRVRKKNDAIDAEYLARVGRVDPCLLYPVRHRKEETQAELALLRARASLVEVRTKLINHVRGIVKSAGGRVPKYSSESFARRAREDEHVPEPLREAVGPVLDTIADLSERIRDYERDIEQRGKAYAEVARFRQIKGVGPITALCYRLVIEDAERFKNARSVGSYVGLVPRLDETGGVGTGPERPITKAGDVMLRTLLVQSAHYIMGPFGPDTDLRRWGLALAARGGKNARKRAVIAVARKLSVLLYSLWVSGEDYEPLRNSTRREEAALRQAA